MSSFHAFSLLVYIVDQWYISSSLHPFDFDIHYVGYIWDSVSVHREGVLWRGVSAKRGSTVTIYGAAKKYILCTNKKIVPQNLIIYKLQVSAYKHVTIM